MKCLITGGVGYIGAHTIVELLNSENDVVVVDNLCNSNLSVLSRVERITGQKISFHKADIRDKETLLKICTDNSFDVCIHFAGLKSPAESIVHPLEYYNNNLVGTISLLEALGETGCKNIIFSSSATVYGNAEPLPSSEKSEKGFCTNPYGWTKWMIEQMLMDIHVSDATWNIVALRYFNPVGAHKSGMIGEEPCGIPNNLMPYIAQVAAGKLDKLTIYGNDYPTPDGTAIRDYIHVVDLAKGHVAALNAISKKCGFEIYNLGTGKGYSVKEVVDTFQRVNKVDIPYIYGERRPGDIAISFANTEKAFYELGWKAQYGLEDMCRDSWNWEIHNNIQIGSQD